MELHCPQCQRSSNQDSSHARCPSCEIIEIKLFVRLPSTVAGVKSLRCSRLLLSARAWLDIEKTR